MKRLFEIVLNDGSKMIPRAFYENKMKAKAERNTLNEQRKNEKGFVGFKITRGPDHRNF